MKIKLLGGLLAATTITALGVASIPIIENQSYVLRATETYNTTVNIECPFGTADGSKFLTITQNNDIPVLGLSDDPINLTIEFNYTTGSFKFPLGTGYVHFKDSKISGGTTMTYTDGLCSGNTSQGVKYYLANYEGTAGYYKTIEYETYIPLIPYYSAEQYISWCLNCSGHKTYFESSDQYLYNLVINKDDVDDEYKPYQEESTQANTYVLTPVSTGSNSAPHNSYAQAATATINNITWSVMGNSNMVPWRIGGKSLNKVNREIYSMGAIGGTVTSIDLEVGAASNITVNSLKIIAASDVDFVNVIETLTETFSANSTITFTPTKTLTSCYYKVIFNVSVSGTSNKFVEFKSLTFTYE